MPPILPPSLVVLDGATGTELDRRGVDIRVPLWSARALLSAHGTDTLAAVHRDYLDAGAGAITANTFRTNARALDKEGLGDRAAELTHAAVAIARRVRDETAPSALVLGSVAPLEDCYRPDLAPDAATCAREHAGMIAALVDAGADAILIETMNNLTETRAAIGAARVAAPGRWLACLCLRGDGPPGVLLGGEPVAGLLGELGDAVAVGVNCVAAPSVETQVAALRGGLPDGVRIAAYANVGYAGDDGGWVITDAVDPQAYAEYAAAWVAAGASIVGGCCGTTPATIAAICRRLGRDLDVSR